MQSRRQSPNIKPSIGCLAIRFTLGIAVLVGAAETAPAQEAAKPAMDTWRPKDGVYAVTGRRFSDRCLEFGDTSIDWKNNNINGGEEECKINRTTDTAPGELRLDLTCTDIERPTPHKEIILLKKINETTLFLRETQNGKFGRPGAQFAYCPAAIQNAYINARKKRQ